MAVKREHANERRARIDAMIDEFRAAQQRRLVKRGIVLWKRTEAADQARVWAEPPTPEKIH
jgi:hypothetical protein